MTKIDKFKAILLRKPTPSDIKYSEMESFLLRIGFEERKTGKTSGSRVRFCLSDDKSVQIRLHKAHGTNPLGQKTVEDIIATLELNGLL